MEQVNVHEAKTHLSRLLKRVRAGEEIIIASAGKPIARLVPFADVKPPRRFDCDRGMIAIADDFDTIPEAFAEYTER